MNFNNFFSDCNFFAFVFQNDTIYSPLRSVVVNLHDDKPQSFFYRKENKNVKAMNQTTDLFQISFTLAKKVIFLNTYKIISNILYFYHISLSLLYKTKSIIKQFKLSSRKTKLIFFEQNMLIFPWTRIKSYPIYYIFIISLRLHKLTVALKTQSLE